MVSPSGELDFIGTRMDLADLRRAEAMQIAVARERKLARRRWAADLAKANEVLRGCIDALASVTELDQFVGQVMAVITGQLGAASLIHLTDPDASVIHNGLRDYFLGQGVGTLLIVPLVSRGEVNKFLSFRFAEKRHCRLENVEVARALATSIFGCQRRMGYKSFTS